MNIIVIRKGARPRQLNLGHPLALAVAATVGLAVAGTLFVTGWWLAGEFGPGRPHEQLVALRTQLEGQQGDLEAARRAADEDLNAYAVRLGQLNAHVIRLDALGDRLTRMAKLSGGEFNFDQPPATGGPEVILGDGQVPALAFQRSLDDLAHQIQDREKQLAVLENLLMNRNLQSQVRPAGRPVEMARSTGEWPAKFINPANSVCLMSGARRNPKPPSARRNGFVSLCWPPINSSLRARSKMTLPRFP